MLKTVDQIQAEIFMALVNKRLKNRMQKIKAQGYELIAKIIKTK
jgi:hypothetical protein